MFKFILKLLAIAAAVAGAFAAFTLFDKNKPSEYIEIYSDDDDQF